MAEPHLEGLDKLNSNPNVSIIIINYNGLRHLKKCLPSIYKNTEYENFEILIVDNGSRDGSCGFIKTNYPNVRIIENDNNLGFAKANNIAISKTNSPYLFFLNNDTEVLKGWLTYSIKLAENSSDIGIVGSKILFMDMNPQYSGGLTISFKIPSKFLYKLIVGNGNKVKKVNRINGAGFLVKRVVFNKVGLFDEDFFLYFEESDFCVRARKYGYDVYYTPHSMIKHFSRGTSSSNDYFGYYLRHKSRIMFYLLDYTIPRLILRLLLEVPIIIYSLITFKIHLLIRAYRANMADIIYIIKKRRDRTEKFGI